ILFVRDTDDTDLARLIARDVIAGVSESVKLPDEKEKLSISVGIAPYNGTEKNYSELFKKADVALYKTKAGAEERFCVYG
ncbi:MAG: diguanylate cyclase, partial [Clostridia bacterium]|nr:diguanylate cyclase [Clostridia bacterium]